MANIADSSWERTLSLITGFMQTPHGEIDLLRWLREREQQLDNNTPGSVIAALKVVPPDMKFFGPQLRATLTIIIENLRRPPLVHKGVS